MPIEISVLISVVGVLLSIATFYIGRTTAATDKGKEAGGISTDLQYIKSGIASIQDELKAQRGTNTEFAVRLAKVEDSLKSIHKRVDAFEKHLEYVPDRGDE